MKKITLLLLLITAFGFAQNTVSVDGSKTWSGYVNAFNTSDDSYAFGFSYDVQNLKTTVAASSVTLQPNFAIWSAENTNTSWFDNATTPNKYIEASSYVENNGLAGSDLTFSANLDAFTMDSAYKVVAFIKALDPNNGYATVVNKNIVLTNGMSSFTISATGAELQSGFIIQYGFSVTGALGDPANEASLGSVVVTENASDDSGNATNDGVTIDGSKTWNGYVNAFNTSDDSYAFGFSYDVANLKTTVAASTVTLQPNFAIWSAENTNASWFDNTTTPNKYIEASSYVENNGLADSDLTFSANIDSYTIDAGYTVVAFIKALDPNNGYATVVNKNVTLTSSMSSFSVSALAAELQAGFIIQYGFSVKGALGNPSNEASLGSVVLSSNAAVASVDRDSLLNISMYPNPTNNYLNISSDNIISKISVYNILGKQVKNIQINEKSKSIDVSNLSKGVYMIKYTIDNAVGSLKFMKN